MYLHDKPIRLSTCALLPCRILYIVIHFYIGVSADTDDHEQIYTKEGRTTALRSPWNGFPQCASSCGEPEWAFVHIRCVLSPATTAFAAASSILVGPD